MKKFLISLIAAVMFILGASQIISACNGIHDNNANASDSQVSSMSEEEYKKSCKEISWKDLCRNPDNYKGNLVKVQVKIQQILRNKTWRAYSDSNSDYLYMDDEYYLTDKRESGDTKILEDDIVIVYGEFDGVKDILRVITGTTSELPAINVRYAELVEIPTCEEIYNEYADKIRALTPQLIDEYKELAKQNNNGITGLADIMSDKVQELANIESEGTSKMAGCYMYSGNGTYDDYQKWAGELWDVYMDEAQKIQDAYTELALGLLN